MERDWQATRNWVENMGTHPFAERSILTAGQSLLAPLSAPQLDREEAIGWLLNQSLEDWGSRIERLEILNTRPSLYWASGNGIDRTNQDFISPIDRVEIPGIPASPVESVAEIIPETTALNQNSIDAILNQPNRTSPIQRAPSSWADSLRDTFGREYEGRFREIIEKEIRDLGPESPPPELPHRNGQND